MNNLVTLILLCSTLIACGANDPTNETAKDTSELKTTQVPDDFEQNVDALVQQYMDIDIFTGVVLVAEENKPLYHKAFGQANRETKAKNTVSTKFDIGSINKVFTTVVMLKLADEGKLKFSDKMGDHLTGWPKEPSKKVTIEMLLTHSSGYGDYFSPDFFDAPDSEKTMPALYERIKKLELLYPPGKGNEYSNAGFVILGAIIESVTGKSYYENVEEIILKPLGMTDTYIHGKSEVTDRAIGYFRTADGVLHDNEMFSEVPTPAGGFYSTATDLNTFISDLFYGNKMLSDEAKKLNPMYEGIKANRNSGGALPFAGGFEGSNAVVYEIQRDKTAIIVLANMDEPVAEDLGLGILYILRGKEPEKPALPAIQSVFKAFNQHGKAYVKANWEDLITNFHPTDPKDMILNSIGYDLMGTEQLDKAIEVFELNTEMFPDCANCYDSLGEAYLNKGDKEKALEFYKKALELDPMLPSAKQMVKELSN